MWDLLKWFSSPSKKEEEATMRAARHHAREARDGNLKDDLAALESRDASPNSVKENTSPRSGKPGRDVYSLSKTAHNIDLRRSANAYWRKNTNNERPSDSRFYTDLTNPAGSNWQNPFSADSSHGRTSARAGMPGADLSNLSAFLTSNNKKYLVGMYSEKNQIELQGQTYDSYRPLPTPADIQAYPHYDGGWQPENLNQLSDTAESSSSAQPPTMAGSVEEVPSLEPPIAQLIATRSAESAALFSAATDAANQNMDLDFAVPVDAPGGAPNSVSATPHPSMWSESLLQDDNSSHKWSLTEPEETFEELKNSLNSVESSPQCEQLFAESASSAKAIFADAKPMRPTEAVAPTEQQRAFPFNAQSQSDQSTTLDSLPEQQFVDVRISAADHADTAPEILRALAYDINPDVRFAVAENHNVELSILKVLANDENPYVAHRAKKTMKRIEGGQLKRGNFTQNQNRSLLSDRKSSMS